jgi:hypothetical protein
LFEINSPLSIYKVFEVNLPYVIVKTAPCVTDGEEPLINCTLNLFEVNLPLLIIRCPLS